MENLEILNKVYHDATSAYRAAARMYRARQCSVDVYLAALKARDEAASACRDYEWELT